MKIVDNLDFTSQRSRIAGIMKIVGVEINITLISNKNSHKVKAEVIEK